MKCETRPLYRIESEEQQKFAALVQRSRCRRLVQGQEAFEDGFFGEVGGPAVGGGDGGVEFRVAGGEPGGADVVEFGEGAVFEASGAGGITRHKTRIAHGADFERAPVGERCRINEAVPRAADGAGKFGDFLVGPFGRVEPVFAEFVKFLGGRGNRGVSGWQWVRHFDHSRRKREGFKAGGRGVAETAFFLP